MARTHYKNINDFIVPAGSIYKRVAANEKLIADGRHNIYHRANGKALVQFSSINEMAQGKVMWTAQRWWHQTFEASAVFCKEHKRVEILPHFHYSYDLKPWYEAGLHPRFSIAKALIEAKQKSSELPRVFWGWTPRAADFSSTREQAVAKLRYRILSKSRTPKQFLELSWPYLRTFIYVRGRRVRVTNDFAEKFKKRSFTSDDFFLTANQELRRIILRSVPILEILRRMVLVGKDDEGALYDFNERRYLYVKCPSTGQEYLLVVPTRFTSPKEARRWTFDLPADAEFLKEA